MFNFTLLKGLETEYYINVMFTEQSKGTVY